MAKPTALYTNAQGEEVRCAELQNTTQKGISFYGKAFVHVTPHGAVLQSYKTFMCVKTVDGKFIKLNGTYSDTTMRHINEFCEQYNVPHPERPLHAAGGKKWWVGLPCHEGHFVHGAELVSSTSIDKSLNA